MLIHEIAHLLHGVSQHSLIGIMKRSWDDTDFLKMSHGQLQFTPEDVVLIDHGLRALQAGLTEGRHFPQPGNDPRKITR